MLYRAYVEGFTGHFNTLDELKVWANDLTARFSLTGCTVKIWKAKGITGKCAAYSSTPDREIVIGA